MRKQSKAESAIAAILKYSTILSFIALWYFLARPNYSLARSEHPWIYFLVGVLFFNTTHIFITFIKLSCLPEFKGLNFLKTRRFKIRCFLIFVSTGIMAMIASYFSPSQPIVGVLFRVFIFGTTIHHTNMQTYGLSSQLDILSEANLLEKRSVLFFTLAAFPVYMLARMSFLISTFYFSWGLALSWMGMMALVLRKTVPSKRSDKSVFLLRYVCVFLSFINPYFTLATMIFHGLEYLQTFIAVRDRSSLTAKFYTYSSVLLWVAVPLAGLFVHFVTISTLFKGESLSPFVKALIESTVLSLNVLHYFLDAKIYQFRNEQVRKSIGPLFRSA